MNSLGKLVAVGVLLVTSCNSPIVSSSTKQARSIARQYVDLVIPTNEGYRIDAFGVKRGTIKNTEVQAVSFTPDMSAYGYLRCSGDPGRRRCALRLRRGSSDSLLFNMSAYPDLPEWRLVWANHDGTSALIQVADRVFVVCVSSSEAHLIASNVLDVDTWYEKVILLVRSPTGVDVVAKDINGATPRVIFSSDQRLNSIRALGRDELILYWRESWDRYCDNIQLLHASTGRVSPLPIPTKRKIVHVIPLRGTDNLLIESFEGDEHLDGSMRTKLYLWNVSSFQRTWLWTKWTPAQLHEAVNNASTLTCR